MDKKLIILLLLTVLAISSYKLMETSAAAGPTGLAVFLAEKPASNVGFQKQFDSCIINENFAPQTHEIELSPEISALAWKVSNGAKTELETASYIYYYIAGNFEYKVFENWRKAGEVLDSRAGDCTDLSVLMVSMLRSVGIESYVVSSGEHAWTTAKVDSKWIQVDSTTKDFWFVQNCMRDMNCEQKELYSEIQEMFNEGVMLEC